MQKTILIMGISLAAGFAAAAIVLRPAVTTPTDRPVESAPVDQRIRALESAVNEERLARQMLEEQLLLLFDEIDRLAAGRDQGAENRAARAEAATEERAFQFRGESAPQRVADNLLEAGLPQERVDWIMQREEELRFTAMQARYDARNSGAALDPFNPGLNPEAMLRAELGDHESEMYLAANNRSTSVAVSNVLASSPAARAGLQPGDRIVAYDGRRVFNGGDLVQETMVAGSGNVVIDVLRDGAPMQVVLPRGPIGVEIGRIRRR
jgi:TolA-binding protein